MSKKKMCPLHYWTTIEERAEKKCGPCPKNTNSRCEIVEPKWVKVKGWAKRGFLAGPGEVVAQSYYSPTGLLRVPCIITLSKKDYERLWPTAVRRQDLKARKK